jgi:hypothetical protein
VKPNRFITRIRIQLVKRGTVPREQGPNEAARSRLQPRVWTMSPTRVFKKIWVPKWRPRRSQAASTHMQSKSGLFLRNIHACRSKRQTMLLGRMVQTMLLGHTCSREHELRAQTCTSSSKTHNFKGEAKPLHPSKIMLFKGPQS